MAECDWGKFKAMEGVETDVGVEVNEAGAHGGSMHSKMHSPTGKDVISTRSCGFNDKEQNLSVVYWYRRIHHLEGIVGKLQGTKGGLVGQVQYLEENKAKLRWEKSTASTAIQSSGRDEEWGG